MGLTTSNNGHTDPPPPPAQRKYSDKPYWDERYTCNEEPFDWLLRWEDISVLMEQLIESKGWILCPGCGNAPVHASMYDAGYTNQVCLDSSTVVIEQMERLNCVDRPEMIWLVRDCTKLDYPDDFFDFIFDKSLIDTIRCVGQMSCVEYIDEMFRVLKPGGLMITLSLHLYDASTIRRYFQQERLQWGVAHAVIAPRVTLIVCEKRVSCVGLQSMVEALAQKAAFSKTKV